MEGPAGNYRKVAHGVLLHGELTSQILDGAIEVHRILGPGLLENAYRSCLAKELRLRGLRVETEVAVPLHYKGEPVDCGFRMDMVVNELVVIELKAVDRILAIHEAQLLTYLKLCRRRVGLLINFNATRLLGGYRRFII
jgi:GxxExxY protein